MMGDASESKGQLPLPDESTATASGAPPPGFIGDFRIVRQLGAGGMGVVYEAEQQDPKRPVALKVVRGGRFIDDAHLRVFRREIQTLARLKHPGIAAIYESGRTSDGQHFFAMELVRGETLAAYCKRSANRALSPAELKERLALFRKICEAVNYAHQRGVIHRDLKPANIFVLRDAPGSTESQGTAAPLVPDIKILDFGLARITDSDIAVSTVLTDLGSVQGTIPYMSPEQVRGNPDEIDLRTDVYSLGVVLYEMLTAQLPHDLKRVQLTEAVRVICEQPTKPLTRAWPGARRPDPDLQTIVSKALEKEPPRRYQSAAALSEDVYRYLSNQPILARPSSTMYHMRKLVTRHKAPFALLAVLFVLLAGFAVTMAVQAGRIARERDRANREAETAVQVSDFLVGLFRVSDPSEARGNMITARELLDRGAEDIQRGLEKQPLTQARLMDTMGEVYKSLALDRQAEPLLAEAVSIRRRELGEEHPEVARSLDKLGYVYVSLGKVAEAESLFQRALQIMEKRYGPDDPEVGWALYHLRKVYWVRQDVERTEQTLTRALRIFERDPGANAMGLAWCLNDLGSARRWAGDYEAAWKYLERALEIKKRIYGPEHPDVAIALNNLGYTLVDAGAYERARPYLEEALELSERMYGPRHPRVADPLESLGEMRWRRGELSTARPLLERARTIQEATLDSRHPDLALTLHTLAAVLRDQGQLAASDSLFQRALAIRESVLGPRHADTLETLKEYATLLHEMHREVEAITLEARIASAVGSSQAAPER